MRVKRTTPTPWSLRRALLIIFLVWLGAVLTLAATEALRELSAPAAPAAPQATPRATTEAPAITCHRSDPPTTSPWLAVARTDAQKYGVDPLTFAWQIWQESGFDPTIHNSPAGAIGIAQFLPDTAEGLGINPRDPSAALSASARLDAAHLKQYAGDAEALTVHYGGSAARHDYGLALSAYNAGAGATTGARDQAYASGTRWPESDPWAWLAWWGQETQHSVPAIGLPTVQEEPGMQIKHPMHGACAVRGSPGRPLRRRNDYPFASRSGRE